MSAWVWAVAVGGGAALAAWSARQAVAVSLAADVSRRLGRGHSTMNGWHGGRSRLALRVVQPFRAVAERRHLVHDLPVALEDVARSLRSGTSLRVALAEAAAGGTGPARGDLGAVVEQADLGVPLAEALVAWATRRPLPDVRLAVAALGLGIDAGFTSARTVDGVAATLRERAAVTREVGAQAAQARLSALVIALLPVAFTSWACLTDGRIAAFLFASAAGWACLAGGIGLNVVGAVWMGRIMRSVS